MKNETLYDVLRFIKTKTGWTESYLSGMLGVNQSTINRILSKKSAGSIRTYFYAIELRNKLMLEQRISNGEK